MSNRPLEVEIYKGNSKEDKFQVNADPANPAALREVLEAWLKANKWARPHWGRFTLVAREPGKWAQLNRVQGRS